jgi:hypothetical protein
MFLYFVVLNWSCVKRGTTKEAKDTKTFQRKSHPQISQIFTEEFKAVSFQSVKI